MTRSGLRASAIALAAACSTSAQAGPASVQVDGDCRTVRIRPDGTRLVTPARNPGRDGAATVTTRKGGSVSSTTSSSHGGGRSVSTSTVDGVTVTVTRDDRGCTAVIDERGSKGRTR